MHDSTDHSHFHTEGAQLDPIYSEKKSRAERGLVFTVNAQNAKRCTKNGRAFGTPLGPRPGPHSARLFLTVNASRAKWGTKFGTPFGIYTKRLLYMNAHSHFTRLLDSKQWKLYDINNEPLLGSTHILRMGTQEVRKISPYFAHLIAYPRNNNVRIQ